MYEIFKITSDTTVDFAAEELKKYMRMMMPRCGEIKISYAPDARSNIRIGLMSDFGLDTTDAEDVSLDDIIYIDMTDDGGIIAGSNRVSVLIAVYRYLKFCGCRWLFPGVDGERIPFVEKLETVCYRHKASYRYRGQCNEGAEFQPNMLETIDFTPKIGMNTYMLEFDNPCYYYNLYYDHKGSKTREPESVHPDTILQWKRQCEAEIQKRGLKFHDMGHGWTAEPYGIDSSNGWEYQPEEAVPEESRIYLAEVNGERKLYGDASLKTNICMSNPKARKIMADYIADYAQKQNNVDFLHIWLADSKNSHCECDECKKKDTADWYIILLNEIDAELTKRGLDTHLVFIVYFDTFWPPVFEKLNSTKRFTMLFAPITRLYTESYSRDADLSSVVPYKRNEIVMPKDMAQCLAYLAKWKENWKGDCFCYEYHFMDFQYQDPSGLYMAKLIYDDVKALKKHGLNGIIEDGSQRSYFPTGLSFYVYGETLYDSEADFDDLVEDYFSHSFGENYKAVLAYFNKIKNLLPFDYYFGNVFEENGGLGRYVKPEMAENAKEAAKIAEEFKSVIKENTKQYFRASTVAWQILGLFNEFVPIMSKITELKALGKNEEALLALQDLFQFGSEKEIYFERYYDHCLFSRAWNILAEDNQKTNLDG